MGKDKSLIRRLILKFLAISTGVAITAAGLTYSYVVNKNKDYDINGIVSTIDEEKPFTDKVIKDLEADSSYLKSRTVFRFEDKESKDKYVKFANSLSDLDPNYISKLDNYVNSNAKRGLAYTRLANNGEEPIYVNVDGLNDFGKEAAKEALDYVFGVVSKINSAYRYQIVDGNKYEEISGENKSRIDISYDEVQNNIGMCYAHEMNNLNDNFIECNKIEIKLHKDLEKETESKKKIAVVIIHELTHGLGFNDVYSGHEDLDNGMTMINIGLGDNYCKYTSNDVKCLFVLYFEFDDYEKDIEKIKDFVAKYEIKYYEKMCENYQDITKFYCTVGEIENPNLKLKCTDNASTVDSSGKSSLIEYAYEIDVNENEYNLKIKLKDGSVISETSGDVVYHNGVIVLKGVDLEKGMHPTSHFQNRLKANIVIFKGDDSYYCLESFSNDSLQLVCSAELNEEISPEI